MDALGLYNYWIVMLFIFMGKVSGGTAPILADGIEKYSNPLTHVLILTAIVVGVATTALGLALIVRIKEAYDSIEEDELLSLDTERDLEESKVQAKENIS